MNGLPYYKAYPRDFVEGTIGMRFELKAAYRLILDMIYMQGGRLPDDARYVSGLLGCSVRAWKKYREELISLGKIQAENGVIASATLDEWSRLSRAADQRPAVPMEIKRSVMRRDGETCAYCGSTDGPFHLDHIYPWARGGEHSEENLTVACAPCNWSKGGKTVEEWRGGAE